MPKPAAALRILLSSHRATAAVIAVAVVATPAAVAGPGGIQAAASGLKSRIGKVDRKTKRLQRKVTRLEKKIKAIAAEPGPTGPAGPAGAGGPAGPAGPAGAAGPTASAFTQSAVTTELAPAATAVLSTAITVETPSDIFASASFEIDSNGGGDDQVFCRLVDDVTSIPISHQPIADLPDTGFSRSFYSLQGAMTRSPGTYTVRLFCGEGSGTAHFLGGNLNVWAIATP